MAKSGQRLGRAGKLSNNTIFQCDNDDLMAKIWELTKEKEKVQQEIEKATMEIDAWLQILDCSSLNELDQLIDDFASNPSILPSSFTILHSTPEREQLAEYCRIVTQLSAYDMLDSSKGYATEDGNLFIKFPWRPPNKPKHDFLLLLSPAPDSTTYSVLSHNLPPTVPLDDLAKEYLHKPHQDQEGLRRFVAVVGQYARSYYSRLEQAMALETSGLLDGTSVHHNKGATHFSFILNPKLKDHPKVLVEFVLKYEPLDILPHTATASPFSMSGEEQIPAGLQDSVNEVASNMKKTVFTQVLLELQHGKRAGEHLSSSSTSTPSTSQDPQAAPSSPHESLFSSESSSGPLFDIGE